MFKSSTPDRRFQPRSPANARGVIVAPGLEVGCTIADTSSGGFRLRLDRLATLPDVVTVIDVGAGLAITVEVAWRQGADVGVKRKEATLLRGLVPSRHLPAREAWLRAGGR